MNKTSFLIVGIILISVITLIGYDKENQITAEQIKEEPIQVIDVTKMIEQYGGEGFDLNNSSLASENIDLQKAGDILYVTWEPKDTKKFPYVFVSVSQGESWKVLSQPIVNLSDYGRDKGVEVLQLIPNGRYVYVYEQITTDVKYIYRLKQVTVDVSGETMERGLYRVEIDKNDRSGMPFYIAPVSTSNGKGVLVFEGRKDEQHRMKYKLFLSEHANLEPLTINVIEAIVQQGLIDIQKNSYTDGLFIDLQRNVLFFKGEQGYMQLDLLSGKPIFDKNMETLYTDFYIHDEDYFMVGQWEPFRIAQYNYEMNLIHEFDQGLELPKPNFYTFDEEYFAFWYLAEFKYQTTLQKLEFNKPIMLTREEWEEKYNPSEEGSDELNK